MDKRLKVLIGFGGLIAVALIAFWIFWGEWMNYASNYEMAFVFDKYTGQIEILPHTGWKKLTPWHYDFHTIDMRPRQLCINANNRVLNCKLVRFNPAGFQQFVTWHGADAFDSDDAGFEILKSYAFDPAGGVDCPFLWVTQSTGSNGLVQVPESR